MMINKLNEIPRCILIFNTNDIKPYHDESPLQNLSNGDQKSLYVNNNKVPTNMKTICSPYLVVPQNSYISFIVNPEKTADSHSGNTPKKIPFKCEEDELLLKLVETYGKNDWKTISILMNKFNFNRNVRQCKDRYLHYLDPKIKQNPEWTKEEDDLLLQKVVEMGNKWKAMEEFFPGRTEIHLRNRYKLLLRKESKEERRQERKKKNIMSDEFSFLDKISANKTKNVMRSNNENGNVFQSNNDNYDLVTKEKNEFYSEFNYDHDILFDNEYEKESQIWIDEELNGYF